MPAKVGEYAVGGINAVEGGGGSLVILIALIILFGGAAYFTGRLYGTVGLAACAVGFVVTVVALVALGGISFG